ncbi:nitrite/sulfite reductase [Sulfolobus sp. E5-1-F]|uniref:nitrite/sulfite reductase n=1 Tax=Saccharolobus sp. E5-1-F TaxID=2663019 RepID=UPI001294F64F|nr:nitrite/sulfite reductase [Sulfolobus sp. E5-1-F]QGA55414.1 nitrite/sulfite reductase [Sulfolobus sp. E5-1-F]
MKIPIEPNFRTDPNDYSEEEKVKLKTKGLTEDTIGIYSSFHDLTRDDLEKEVSLIAKSFGIYMEFNRDKMKSNGVKDWIYMVRLPIPGGGPIRPNQWRILDDISNKYTISDAYTGNPLPSLKLTTRQAIQFHHVKKKDLPNLIREIAESGFLTINGCGDNIRNTIACPLSRYWIFDANSLARKIANYFRLPLDLYLQVFEIPLTENIQFERESFKYSENLLPRKFKIAIVGVLRTINGKYIIDNCVEVRANDIGIAPLINDDKVVGYQIYVGGSMGENNSYPTFSALGLPIGTVVNDGELLRVLDAIVRIQEEWGDRKNRHWARFKYVVYKMGLEWLRDRVREYSGIQLGKIANVNLTHRELHLGWIDLGDNKWAYGIFVENGRLIDGKNGRIKSMVRYIADNFDNVMFYITPNQHLLITEIDQSQKEKIEAILKEFNYGFRDGKPYSNLRINSIACVGFPTCKLSFTDSERFLPGLIDELERRGWKDIQISIGLSGCVAQCSRPALHPISWVGSGYELYMLKIGGGNGSLGEPLIDWDENSIYLYQVPSNRLADVTEALFELYEKNKDLSEDPGEVFRLLGNKKIIEWLKSHEKTKDLMKPHKFDRKIEGYREYHNLLQKRLEEVNAYG